MDKRIATISGTMLTPGVSRNQRLYTPEVIAKAAGRMAERIADPDGLPITMRTHHQAGDDSRLIVGRIRTVTVKADGSAAYSADLYDTAPGRDIASLVVPGKDQPPALKSVSIHGYWLGPVKTVTHDGESVTTGDDLEVDSVDFTGTPGVLGATIDSASWVRPATAGESTAGRTPISESVDATVQAVTEIAPAPPIRSKGELRRAIRESHHATDRVHVMQRAQALGLTALIPTHWNQDGTMTESTRYSDIREYYDGPGGAAGFCIDAYNGPTSVTIRNCSLDPAELRVVAAAAMDAIVSALQAVDPDMDGDVDVDGAPKADTDDDAGAASGEAAASPDDDMETAPAPGQRLTAEQATTVQAAAEAGLLTPGQAITEATLDALPHTSPPDRGEVPTTKEEATMAEPTPTIESAAPAPGLTAADIPALGAAIGAALAESLKPILTPAAPVAAAETVAKPVVDKVAKTAAKEAKKAAKAAALAETAASAPVDVAAIVAQVTESVRTQVRADVLKEYGLPPRQGFRVHENDHAPDDAASLFEDRASLLLGAIGIPAAPQTA